MYQVFGWGSLNTLLHADILVKHILHRLCCLTLDHGYYTSTLWLFERIARRICLARHKIFRGLIERAQFRVVVSVYTLRDKSSIGIILILRLNFEEITRLIYHNWRVVYCVVCFAFFFFWRALAFSTPSMRMIKKFLIVHDLTISDKIVIETCMVLVPGHSHSFIILAYFVGRMSGLNYYLRWVLRLLSSLVFELIGFLNDRHRTSKSNPLSRGHLFAHYDWSILFSLLVRMLIWVLCDWLGLRFRRITQHATLIFFVSIRIVRLLVLFDVEVIDQLRVFERNIWCWHRNIGITDYRMWDYRFV